MGNIAQRAGDDVLGSSARMDVAQGRAGCSRLGRGKHAVPGGCRHARRAIVRQRSCSLWLAFAGFKDSFQGKECYGTVAVKKAGDGIDLSDLDEDKMRAANSWYPKQVQSWEGKQMGCGNLVIRAEAARHQRVVVALDPKSWFGGPLHRLPADRLDKNGGAR